LNKTVSMISATILGVTIMLLPVLLVRPSFQYDQPQPASSESLSNDLTEEVKGAQVEGKSDVGAVAFPSSLIHAALVTLLGFVAALGISSYAKRKVSVPP